MNDFQQFMRRNSGSAVPNRTLCINNNKNAKQQQQQQQQQQQ